MTPAPPGQVAHPGLERRPGSMMVRAWGTAPAGGLRVDWPSKIPREFTADGVQAGAAAAAASRSPATAESRHEYSSGTGDFADEREQPLKLAPVALTTVAGPPEGRRVLAAHISVPVAEDITVINKTSQNLHAELLLRLLGKTLWHRRQL